MELLLMFFFRLQREREEALADFKSGKMPILVATSKIPRTPTVLLMINLPVLSKASAGLPCKVELNIVLNS